MNALSPWPALAVLLLLLLAGPAPAGEPRRPQPHRPVEGHPGEELTLEEAIARVRKRHPGRLLSARRHDGEYRVRILTPDGRVKRFRLDRHGGRLR